jgi:hypothetical protein
LYFLQDLASIVDGLVNDIDVPIFGLNENVGKSYGLEIETALRLLPQLRLGGKYTYR